MSHSTRDLNEVIYWLSQKGYVWSHNGSYSVRHVKKLAEAISKYEMHRLELAFHPFADEGAAILASVFPKTLQTLILQRDNIHDEGAAAIAAALPETTIIELDLGFNEIGDKGAAAIAQAFPKTPLLGTLYLAYNNIGDAGAAAIAEMLPTSHFAELSLSENRIGDAGAIALAKALPQSYVYRLDLSGNSIGPEGVTALAEAFADSKVATLELSSPPIGSHPITENQRRTAEDALLKSKNIIEFRGGSPFYTKRLSAHMADNESKAGALASKMLNHTADLTKEDLIAINERSGAIMHLIGVSRKVSPLDVSVLWKGFAGLANAHGVAWENPFAPRSSAPTAIPADEAPVNDNNHVARLGQRRQKAAECGEAELG